MNISSVIKSLKLPADERRALESLIDTPEAREFLDRQDEHRVERRKALKAAIAEADAQAERERAVTAQAVRDAVKAYEVAEAALREAERLHSATAAANFGAGAASRRARWAAERELAETCDSRLAEFRRQVSTLEDGLQWAARSWSALAPRNILGRREVKHHSNAAEVNAASKLCRACQDDLSAMAADALTWREITERLAGWAAKLAAAAGPFDLAVPSLDERGEVAPLRGPGGNAPVEVRAQAARQLGREAVA